MLAVLLPVLLAIAAFSVDISYMQLTRGELRAATDAAARTTAAANRVGGKPLLLRDEEIIFGNATFADHAWAFTPNGTPFNSVHVVGSRTGSSLTGGVDLFFGRAIGTADFQPQLTTTVVRLDRDICLVLDRSSSMKFPVTANDATYVLSTDGYCNPPAVGTRWMALVDAVNAFITGVNETPTRELIGLVSYSSNISVCGAWNEQSTIERPLMHDYASTQSAINALTTGGFNGMTNISAGIDSAVSVLTERDRARPFAYKTMILFTDGNHNEGRSPILAAADAAAQGIAIHTITFSVGANQADMQAVAAATGGMHYHAPTAADLTSIFYSIAAGQPVTFAE